MTTIPTRNELLAEIRSTLQNAVSPTFTQTAPNWSLYEVYNFCLVIEEAIAAGATNFAFYNSNNTLATSYTFRTNPSALTSTDPYTYAEINFPNKQPLEVHVGVFISEKSMERIQCDVVVIQKNEADFFRQQRVRNSASKPPRFWPDSLKVLLAIECKYLTDDMKSDEAHEFVGRSQAIHTSHFYLVTNTLSIAAGHRVLAHSNLEKNSAWQHDVVPSKLTDINRFRGVLRQVFDNYKSDTKSMS